jgi:putative phosphoesterase
MTIIAILSDTHNNSVNLFNALVRVDHSGIGTIIHCGDLGQPERLSALRPYRLIFTLGNNDTNVQAIRTGVISMGSENSCAYTFSGEIDGVPIVVTHGHIPGKVDELVQSGLYRYVFRGHSHRREDRIAGATRVINPGALGGLKPQERSFCILDLETGQVEFVLL